MGQNSIHTVPPNMYSVYIQFIINSGTVTQKAAATERDSGTLAIITTCKDIIALSEIK